MQYKSGAPHSPVCLVTFTALVKISGEAELWPGDQHIAKSLTHTRKIQNNEIIINQVYGILNLPAGLDRIITKMGHFSINFFMVM